jgi:hypothetical protein
MSTLLSNAALSAALLTNRTATFDSDAVLKICDDSDGATGFTATADPVLRFGYKFKTTTDTSTFRVGFRTAGDTDFAPGYGVTIYRDGSTETAELTSTWPGTFDVVEGDGVVFVSISPSDLDSLSGVAVEIAVDLNGGEGVDLIDLRYDLTPV